MNLRWTASLAALALAASPAFAKTTVIRAGADDAGLVHAIRLAIDAKPQGHDFQIARAAAPAVARHMSTTGG